MKTLQAVDGMPETGWPLMRAHDAACSEIGRDGRGAALSVGQGDVAVRSHLHGARVLAPFRRGVARFESVSGLFCQWRTNVSLVFSIRRMLPESSAAAPSNETRIAPGAGG
jgi:hypothetical protein